MEYADNAGVRLFHPFEQLVKEGYIVIGQENLVRILLDGNEYGIHIDLDFRLFCYLFLIRSEPYGKRTGLHALCREGQPAHPKECKNSYYKYQYLTRLHKSLQRYAKKWTFKA